MLICAPSTCLNILNNWSLLIDDQISVSVLILDCSSSSFFLATLWNLQPSFAPCSLSSPHILKTILCDLGVEILQWLSSGFAEWVVAQMLMIPAMQFGWVSKINAEPLSSPSTVSAERALPDGWRDPPCEELCKVMPIWQRQQTGSRAGESHCLATEKGLTAVGALSLGCTGAHFVVSVSLNRSWPQLWGAGHASEHLPNRRLLQQLQLFPQWGILTFFPKSAHNDSVWI